MARILVTGGAGFIGSHVVDALVAAGAEVAVVDNLATGHRENLRLPRKDAAFAQLDLQDASLLEVFRDQRPESVVHLAAQSSVAVSMRDPGLDARSNILGAINLLRCCQETGVGKLVYASTGGALYGEPVYLPCDESHAIQPLSYYALSKHTVERYLQLFGATAGLRYAILRFANVYGPRQDPEGEGGVVAIFAHRMLRGEAPTIFGDGEQTRDFIYVGDVVRACLLALEQGEGQAYNIGTGTQTSVNTIFKQLAQLTGYRPSAEGPAYKPSRPGEVRHIALSPQKAAKELGWRPQVALAEGLQNTVAYFRQAPGAAGGKR
ncbi:MAG: NAD-dependent epimerase/dehydratase family protein [Dehalococcoidia bacterium]|nr:NAD-dependent epimerase/dehydratase family protein [Dehalococcoidia bacterium]